MNLLKLIDENIKLRRKANTFESRYNAVNEELLTLYRNKSHLADERDQYKEQIIKIKEENKKLKKEKSILQEELKEATINLEKVNKETNRGKKNEVKATRDRNKDNFRNFGKDT